MEVGALYERDLGSRLGLSVSTIPTSTSVAVNPFDRIASRIPAISTRSKVGRKWGELQTRYSPVRFRPAPLAKALADSAL